MAGRDSVNLICTVKAGQEFTALLGDSSEPCVEIDCVEWFPSERQKCFFLFICDVLVHMSTVTVEHWTSICFYVRFQHMLNTCTGHFTLLL